MKFNNQFAKINQSPFGTIIAYKDGPKQKSGWSYTSWKGMQSYLWKIIMRGVYDWHFVHKNHFNLPSPPLDLKIRANTGTGGQYCTMIRTNLQDIPLPATQIMTFYFNDIRVGNPNIEYYLIYKTTVHEIAHATHWYALGSNNTQRAIRMLRSRKMVREGWAMAFTDHALHYKYFDPSNPDDNWYYGGCNNYAYTDLTTMKADERPRVLGQDMWDNVNQFNASNTYCDVVDNVSGIPLQDLFTALQGVGDSGTDSENYRMMLWRNNISNLHPSQATEIHNYFSQYHLN